MESAQVLFEFTYGFEENEDYFESNVIKRYTKELAKRNKVDGIVIQTGYLGRLTLDNIKFLKACAIIHDEEVKLFSECNFIEHFKEYYGSIVFNNTDAKDAVKLINELDKLNYCACCSVSNISNLIWYKVDDLTVLYVEMDTESG